MNRSSIIPYIGFGVIIVLIVGYVIFRFTPLLSGPQIKVTSPETYLVTESSTVNLVLETKRVTMLEIQGLPIDIQKSGTTEYPYILSEGINRIDIRAEDKYGSEKKRAIVVIKKVENPQESL